MLPIYDTPLAQGFGTKIHLVFLENVHSSCELQFISIRNAPSGNRSNLVHYTALTSQPYKTYSALICVNINPTLTSQGCS